ncbi:MAG: protein kinase [Rhodobacterales bacterium]|nr:protein kinase [Rhodobacterales bacterium]
MIPSTFHNGQYELLSLLGKGASGEIWRVLDTELQVERAAKLVLAKGTGGKRAVREQNILKSLNHPAILQVFDCFEEGGWCVTIVEICQGSLSDRVRERGPLDSRSVVEVAIVVLQGLSTAHASDVVHRDIKPSNLLIGADGRIRLADFGVAALPLANELLTSSGGVIGTIGFMAPEQRRGEAAANTADLYAVAATLAWLGLGEPVGDLYAPGVSRRLRLTFGDGLAGVILKAGRHAPHDRYQTADDMASALQELPSNAFPRRGMPAGSSAESRVPSSGRRVHPRGWMVGVTAMFVVAGAFLVWERPTAPPVLNNLPLCGEPPVTFGKYSFIGPAETQGVAAGDLDNDGTMDVVFANQLDQSLSIYWSAQPPAMTLDAGRVASNPVIGDLDGDGIADLLLAKPDFAMLEVWRFDGRSIRDRREHFQAGTPWAPHLFDYDGDGDDDVLLSLHGADSCLAWRENLGTAYAPHRCLIDVIPSMFALGESATGIKMVSITEGVLSIRPLGGLGLATLERTLTSPDVRLVPGVADVDRDGNDEVYLWRAQEAGPLVRVEMDSVATACRLGKIQHTSSDLMPVDLDGDRIVDLVGWKGCEGCTSQHLILRGQRH